MVTLAWPLRHRGSGPLPLEGPWGILGHLEFFKWEKNELITTFQRLVQAASEFNAGNKKHMAKKHVDRMEVGKARDWRCISHLSQKSRSKFACIWGPICAKYWWFSCCRRHRCCWKMAPVIFWESLYSHDPLFDSLVHPYHHDFAQQEQGSWFLLGPLWWTC